MGFCVEPPSGLLYDAVKRAYPGRRDKGTREIAKLTPIGGGSARWLLGPRDPTAKTRRAPPSPLPSHARRWGWVEGGTGGNVSVNDDE